PLVIATTPAGATDALTGAVPEAPGTLFDVLYDPWPTALAAAWSGRGGTLLGGLDLLVHQAVLQVEQMTGRPTAPLAAMRAAGEEALRARH
ncbi:shikimate dehydrogenase, partial [Streptomyces sp. NPDC059564]